MTVTLETEQTVTGAGSKELSHLRLGRIFTNGHWYEIR